MRTFHMLCMALLGVILVACDSRIDIVNAEMSQIENQPALPIQAAPKFNTVPSFQYDAGRLRSPFLPSSVAIELNMRSARQVKPNFSRTPQALENYPLEALQMKGSLHNKNGQAIALIQTPDGQIERVQVGHYLGQNQGRIVAITTTKIDLMEMIADGQQGYVERSRHLILLQATP